MIHISDAILTALDTITRRAQARQRKDPLMLANNLTCQLWTIKALANPRRLQLQLKTTLDSELAHDAQIQGLTDIVRRLLAGELSRVELPPDARELKLMLGLADTATATVDARRIGARLVMVDAEDGPEVRLVLTYELQLDTELLIWCANHLRDEVELRCTCKQLDLELPLETVHAAGAKAAKRKRTEAARMQEDLDRLDKEASEVWQRGIMPPEAQNDGASVSR